MPPFPSTRRTILHYFLGFLGSSVVLLLMFTGLVYYLAVSDEERVPQIIQELSEQELGVQAHFDHYQFQYFDYFPFLSLSLYNLTLRDTAFEQHDRELLRIKELDLVFRPWPLLQKQVEIRSLNLDSIRVQVYRAANGYSNLDFLKGARAAKTSPDSVKVAILDQLDDVAIRGLFFSYEDDSLHKAHRIILEEGIIGFEQRDTLLGVSLKGNAFSKGLTFKPDNGPFLEHMQVGLDLQLGMALTNQRWHLLEASEVMVLGHPIGVQGYLEPGKPGLLHLEIQTPGIPLKDGQQILSENIRKATSQFNIEGDLPVKVVLHGHTIRGRPLPLEVKVDAKNIALTLDSLSFTDMHFRTRFINNCDTTAGISPETACLWVDVDTALLFGALPVTFSYFNHNLQSPEVSVSGKLKAPLGKFRPYLPKQSWDIKSGWLDLNFELEGDALALVDNKRSGKGLKLRGGGQLTNATLWHPALAAPFENITTNFRFNTNDLELWNGGLVFEDQQITFSGSIRDLVKLAFQKPARLRADLALGATSINIEEWITVFSAQRKPAVVSSYAPGQRMGNILDQLATKLEGNIRIKTQSFSYRKLQATDVSFEGALSRSCAGGGTCFEVSDLKLTAFKNINLSGAALLTQLEDPQLAFELNTKGDLSSLQPLIPSKVLNLKSGQYALQLSYGGSLASYGDLRQAILQSDFQGQVILGNAAFDYVPQGYDFDHVDAAIRFNGPDLTVENLKLAVNGNSGKVKGEIHELLPFILGKRDAPLYADLSVESKGVDLNAFEFLKTDTLSQSPSGSVIGQTLTRALERIEGKLKVRSDTLQFQDLRLSDVYFESQFLNACGPLGACVQFDTLQAELFGNTPMNAKIRVSQLHDPYLEAQVAVDMPLQELDRMFSSAQLRFIEGSAAVQFEYSGHPHRHVEVQEALLKADLRGTGHIRNGQFTFVPRGYDFKKVDTRFSFDGADLHLEQVDLLLNNSSILGQGTICNFLPFLFLPDHPLIASFDIRSPHFDLNEFKAPEQFRDVEVVEAETPTVITQLVNDGLENIEANFHMELDLVNYQNFAAKAVAGRIEMGKGRVTFDETTMDLADGTFRLSGEITGLEENQPQLNLQADLQDTDVRKAFQAFNDFGQSALQSDNLEGKLSADIRLECRL
ncbi:MAG: AsmA family protein, partial [Phaeodactylibacter sp.]|nr:AsmA family protein [Phaeodactylibacter sp.]